MLAWQWTRIGQAAGSFATARVRVPSGKSRLLAELHRDSLYPMMGKDAWVAGADRGEAPGPKPVRLGRRLRLRRQPPGSWQLWNGGVQRGVWKIPSGKRAKSVPPGSSRRSLQALRERCSWAAGFALSVNRDHAGRGRPRDGQPRGRPGSLARSTDRGVPGRRSPSCRRGLPEFWHPSSV